MNVNYIVHLDRSGQGLLWKEEVVLKQAPGRHEDCDQFKLMSLSEAKKLYGALWNSHIHVACDAISRAVVPHF